MPAPTFVAEYETAWTISNVARTTGAFNASADDLLVCIAMTEDAIHPMATPTNTGTALTWTLRQSVTVANYCTAYVWTAPVIAAMTGMTVSANRTSSGSTGFGINVLHFRDTAGVGASSKANASGAPSLGLTTTVADSAVVVAVSDWNAASGTGRSWRTVGVAATEQTYQQVSGIYTVYAARHANAGAAGAKTAGLAAPSGLKYSIIAVEILGQASSIPEGTAAGVVGITGAAAGTTTRIGSSSAGLAITAQATGTTRHTGSAAGSLHLTGAAGGGTTKTGAASGAVHLDGVAGGASTPHGTTAGTLQVTAAASGTTDREGAAGGTLTVAGIATGTAPDLDTPTGTAAGALTLTGAAAGHRHPAGHTAGTLLLAGTAAGITTRSGAAATTVTLTGTATGRAPSDSDGELHLAVTARRRWTTTWQRRAYTVQIRRRWEAQ